MLREVIVQRALAMAAVDTEAELYWAGPAGEWANESRRELTVRTLLALPDEERAHFAATVGRIAGNLAVGRDARDAELHAKVSEVQAHVDAYQTMYAAGEGSPL